MTDKMIADALRLAVLLDAIERSGAPFSLESGPNHCMWTAEWKDTRATGACAVEAVERVWFGVMGASEAT